MRRATRQVIRLVLLLIARTALRTAQPLHPWPKGGDFDRQALRALDYAIDMIRHYDAPRFLRAKGWR